MAVWWERNYPYLVSFLLVAIVLIFNLNLSLSQVLPTAITAASIVAGFLSTLATILLSIDSKGIRFLKRIKKFGTIINYLWAAIRWAFAFVVLSSILQMLRQQNRWQIILWLLVGIITFTSAFRAIDISLAILRSVSEEENPERN